ncbi:hypothetical protein ACH5A2_02785 [Streptomyces collinus]|uniref:hypothetical protein n=1 Tax=Streptomyces collinus TaxID=42684 RepID=UPI0037B88717
MSRAGRSWADHPFVVFLGVVAAAIGVLVGIKELAGSSEDPPSVSAPAPTTPSNTVWPSDDTKALPTPEEDAPQSPDEEETTPSSTPRRPSAEAPPPGDQEPEPPQHTGALTVLVKMGRVGRVGPNSWRAGAEPGANTEVYDATGRLDTGCYVQWTLKHDGKVVQKDTSSRCRPPSITLFDFEDGLEPGSYTLTAEVTTDWNQTGTDTFSFDVVPA